MIPGAARQNIRSLATVVDATSTSGNTVAPSSHPARKPTINAAVILNRSPTLTRTPTSFERAYYEYQARIQRALHNPFPYEFYFKQGSPLENRFNIEERKRERKAFGFPFGKEETEAEGSSPKQLVKQEGDDEVLMGRKHEADVKNDVRSLDRLGQRNLYLLLQESRNGKESWRFPFGGVQKGELLHQASILTPTIQCYTHSYAGCSTRLTR